MTAKSVKMGAGKTGKRRAMTSRVARLAATGKLSPASAALLDEVRAAGLLEGDKTQHVSFRATPALVEAAMRRSGATSMTELGVLALALLAQPDPVADFMKATRGELGADHTLDY